MTTLGALGVPAGALAGALACAMAAGLARAAPPGDWPAYGNDPGGSQFSPLAQVNRDNVARLAPAWEHHSGDVVDAPGLAGTSYEVTPVHAAGRLFYCTPLNRTIALDPATGRQLWAFDPHAPRAPGAAPLAPGKAVPVACRGVAYWQAHAPAGRCDRRVFRGDFMARLWALDAETGEPCADFGAAAGHPGWVDTRAAPNDGEGWWLHTSPPAVIGDTVVIGSALDDMAANALDGLVQAFDARSGAPRWTFNPVPEALRGRVGGGNAWSTLSVDPARGLVFVPTTALSADYSGAHRGAGSELADAVVALDAATGAVRWSRQLVRHDLFDYDLPGHPLLVTIRKDGRARDVVVQQTKMGEVFVLDRDGGEPVFPIVERPAPASDVPGERSAPTQPSSPGIGPFARQSLDAEALFGLTPLDRGWCRRELAASRYDGLYTPPSTRGSIVYPSIRGGGNWGGAAFDAAGNQLVVRTDGLATRVQLFRPADPAAQRESRDYADRSLPMRGTPWWVRIRPFLSPLGIPCTPPPWGELVAIDMDTGKRRWRVPLGAVRRFGIELPESLGWGSPNVGGPLVTAGGLVFVAAGLDHVIRAFDARDGRVLWRHRLPAPGMAVPMTYEAGGRQYVVIAAGGNAMAGTAVGDAIVAFRLPGPGDH